MQKEGVAARLFLGISTAEILRRTFINFLDGDTSETDKNDSLNFCRKITAEICCAKLLTFAFFPTLFMALCSLLFR